MTEATTLEAEAQPRPYPHHEPIARWLAVAFLAIAGAMVVLGVISIARSEHGGGAWLGAACALVGALYLVGLGLRPGWISRRSDAH